MSRHVKQFQLLRKQAGSARRGRYCPHPGQVSRALLVTLPLPTFMAGANKALVLGIIQIQFYHVAK